MTAPALSVEAPSFPAAPLDRRFYAFTIDRLIAWSVDLALALLIVRTVVDGGSLVLGIVLIVVAAMLVGLAFAAVQGLKGLTPGKAALGLRVVHLGSGTPIGVVASMLRSFILGVSALPTFGLGVATLAWTAVMDRDRLRRGWHDHRTESIVVDVRPAPVEEANVDQGPRHIVNLTAMRLLPVPQAVPASAPARRTTPLTPVWQPATTRPSPPSATTPPSPAGWRVTFDTGETFLVEGLALVGRRPEQRPGEPVRHLVPLSSSDMSLSKTHAQFQVALDGVLVVMDRGSTNGTVLVRSGVSRELHAGKPTSLLTGDLVRLGDRQMLVAREP